MSRQEIVVARLMALAPHETEAGLLANLTDLLGSPVSIETRTLFPNDGPSYRIPIQIRVGAAVTQEQATEALRRIEVSFTPLSGEVIVQELTKLWVSTAKRRSDADTVSVIATVYAEAMRAYPADIALSVMRKSRQFWPTLHELREEADKAVLGRNMLREHFERLASGRLVSHEKRRPDGPRKLSFDWRARAGLKPVELPT